MIQDFPGHAHVFLAIGATDMRKSINGLSLLVEEQFALDLFSGSYFAFCNRRRDIVKILYWEESGLSLDEAPGKGCVSLAGIRTGSLIWL